MITGTSYFVSKTAALRYYAYEEATMTDVEQKIAEGAIHIGKPEIKQGQKLITIDNGARYAIVDLALRMGSFPALARRRED